MNVVHRNPGELSGSTGNNFELRLCVLVFVIFSEITTIPLGLGSGRRDVEQFTWLRLCAVVYFITYHNTSI